MCRSMLHSPLVLLSLPSNCFMQKAVSGQSQLYNLTESKHMKNGLKRNITSINININIHIHTHTQACSALAGSLQQGKFTVQKV